MKAADFSWYDHSRQTHIEVEKNYPADCDLPRSHPVERKTELLPMVFFPQLEMNQLNL